MGVASVPDPNFLAADVAASARWAVNGPAVATKENQLVVSWATFADAKGRVAVIFSKDDGKTFGKPLQVDGGNPVGRVDVEWWNDKSAMVSWMERKDLRTSEIRIRKVGPNGRTEFPFTPPICPGARWKSRRRGFSIRLRSTEDWTIVAGTVFSPKRKKVGGFRRRSSIGSGSSDST